MRMYLRLTSLTDILSWEKGEKMPSPQTTVKALHSTTRERTIAAADTEALVNLGWEAIVVEDDHDDQIVVGHKDDPAALGAALAVITDGDWMIDPPGEADYMTVDEAKIAFGA